MMTKEIIKKEKELQITQIQSRAQETSGPILKSPAASAPFRAAGAPQQSAGRRRLLPRSRPRRPTLRTHRRPAPGVRSAAVRAAAPHLGIISSECNLPPTGGKSSPRPEKGWGAEYSREPGISGNLFSMK